MNQLSTSMDSLIHTCFQENLLMEIVSSEGMWQWIYVKQTAQYKVF